MADYKEKQEELLLPIKIVMNLHEAFNMLQTKTSKKQRSKKKKKK